MMASISTFVCIIASIYSGVTGYELSCTNETFLKLNDSTLTTLCRFRGKTNETIENVTLANINQLGNVSKKLGIKVKKTSNGSEVIILNETKIAWDLDGHYLLKIMFSNGSVDMRKFILHVLDYPVMPDTNYKLCNDTNSLCFHLQFPNIHSKDSFHFAKYSFNHFVRPEEQRCASYIQKDLVPCLLNNKKNLLRLTCKIQWLDICKDKNVVECLKPYNMMVYGVNIAGLSKSIHFQLIPPFKVMKSHRSVNNVNVETVSSTHLKVVWKRPRCKYLEYVYRPSYKVPEGGPWTTLETTLSDSYKDEGYSFKRDITRLKPYTTYKVCVESYDEVLGSNFIKGACVTKQTLQAAPSKGPSKVRPRPISTGKDTWACEIVWEGVSKEHWNGVVKHTIIEIRKDKKPNALAMPKIFVPIGKTRYQIEGLSKDFDYLAVLKLCTKGGCTSTKEIPISIKNNEDGHSLSTRSIVSIVIGSSVLTVILTLVIAFSVRSCLKRSRNIQLQRLVDSAEGLDPVEVPDTNVIIPRGQCQEDSVYQDDDHIYEEIAEQGPAEPFIQNNSYERVSSMEALRDDESFAQLQRTDGEEEDSESLEMQSEISSRTYSIETDPLMPIA